MARFSCREPSLYLYHLGCSRGQHYETNACVADLPVSVSDISFAARAAEISPLGRDLTYGQTNASSTDAFIVDLSMAQFMIVVPMSGRIVLATRHDGVNLISFRACIVVEDSLVSLRTFTRSSVLLLNRLITALEGRSQLVVTSRICILLEGLSFTHYRSG